MLLKKWFHSTTQRPFGLSCANAIIVKPFSRFVPTLRIHNMWLNQVQERGLQNGNPPKMIMCLAPARICG
ncbi:unnamed protein product [Malassezia sympodialis ATCC 42132]|uniref:uncharacterized protein n=1 Tax=Malassezia sympodialis (strain ATCC 42132) TaxID=1230383 RepID=UPI0002C19F73|nr:uncharacterized protein MSY001_2077 [Malassezia sympodialis ATCC 42132]CCU99371.1 unnamed protein product [Malassezia sympodialis ATCC 42132]|eukprot:XP_018740624.1 uncharacterized protein MSY001_2077 [Malassezia sympodialis ATCC 42132]